MKLDLKKMGVLSAILLGSLGLTSCLDNDDELPIAQDAGYVAFFNVSPDSNGLRFYANGMVINQNTVGYTQFLNYVPFEIGSHQISVNGGNSNLDTISLNVGLERSYSVFAVNHFENLELVAYEDVVSAPAAGMTSMRFIQLSPDAPNLTVKIEGVETSIGEFNFKQGTSFVQMNPVSNRDMYLIDTETQDTLLTEQISLNNGRVYSVFSRGFLETTNSDQRLDVQVIPYN